MNLPSSHTAAERRVCHRRTAADHRQLGVRECSSGNPSETKKIREINANILEWWP